MNAFFYTLRCRCKELYFDTEFYVGFQKQNKGSNSDIIRKTKKHDKTPSDEKKANKIVNRISEDKEVIKNNTDLKNYIKYSKIVKKKSRRSVVRKYNESQIPPVLNKKSLEKFTSKSLDKSQIFQMKYNQNLSKIAKLTLANLQNKHIYSAIDDILYNCKLNPIERNMFLSTLHSIMISLHNSFSINFFNIFIQDIYIEKVFNNNNKFINNNNQFSEQITFIIRYTPGLPVKKKDVIW
uniref:Hypothetical chloroplast RF88 n=1 Tax=Climaconeis cf. scalaris TaxID=2846828 RepID=A0A8F8SRM7_9STRA|nr:hypothetical chloroplast RF88 [Climaconeis cf. scalaris]QYB19370.1 hypothetical chloroplast RF88 [Climaconeis cf. scalaris]